MTCETWRELNVSSQKYEKSLDKNFRKNNGIYYTDLDLAYYLMKELISESKLLETACIEDLRFLEPCVGTGNFVLAYVRVLLESKKNLNIERVLNNLYVADADSSALDLFFERISLFLSRNLNYKLSSEWRKTNCLGPLIYDLGSNPLKYIPLTAYLDCANFDIIATNPPYKNLRAERRHYNEESVFQRDKNLYRDLSKILSSKFRLANSGTKNVYKYFVEEILVNYLAPSGVAALLIPQTFLSESGTTYLRKYLIEKKLISRVYRIDEKSKWVTASQALCSISICKKKKPSKIVSVELNEDFTSSKEIEIECDQIGHYSEGYAIASISKEDAKLLSFLGRFPKLKDLNFISNLRGELDLSLNKESIADSGSYKLVRGRHIRPYFLDIDALSDYVDDDFISKSSKRAFIQRERIACQQISNMKRKKRLFFSLVPKGVVLGNSVNFIAVDENELGIDIYYLLGILNSDIYDWLFRLYSNNNHISNKELGQLPIIDDKSIVEAIKSVSRKIYKTDSMEYLSDINKILTNFVEYNLDVDLATFKKESGNIFISRMFDDLIASGFRSSYIESVVSSKGDCLIFEMISNEIKNSSFGMLDKEIFLGIVSKYKELFSSRVLNWENYKLSELDLEMIKNVPQGGNWKYIPPEVVAKSKRLQGIQKTGGRTTLYGRLSYDQPSYTISTYFNRPGNGTYVHPTKDRVITAREAARLQSFPDTFYFCGSKSKLLKQIGNAVPPLLAYKIAVVLRRELNLQSCIDLFSGAGGMSVGLEKAGIKVLAGSDFDFWACCSFGVNHPNADVVLGDISTETIKEKIVGIAQSNRVDLICGGPPCQGFSHAGLRFIDDPRNLLFKEFLEVCRRVRPKCILMENVEGILSFNKGKTYRNIIDAYSEIGYSVTARKLNAAEFGVPQRRKRVIFIAVLQGSGIQVDSIFENILKSRSADYVTTKDAIGDFDANQWSNNSVKRHAKFKSWIKS